MCRGGAGPGTLSPLYTGWPWPGSFLARLAGKAGTKINCHHVGAGFSHYLGKAIGLVRTFLSDFLFEYWCPH